MATQCRCPPVCSETHSLISFYRSSSIDPTLYTSLKTLFCSAFLLPLSSASFFFLLLIYSCSISVHLSPHCACITVSCTCECVCQKLFAVHGNTNAQMRGRNLAIHAASAEGERVTRFHCEHIVEHFPSSPYVNATVCFHRRLRKCGILPQLRRREVADELHLGPVKKLSATANHRVVEAKHHIIILHEHCLRKAHTASSRVITIRRTGCSCYCMFHGSPYEALRIMGEAQLKAMLFPLD